MKQSQAVTRQPNPAPAVEHQPSPPELSRRAAMGQTDADVLTWVVEAMHRHVVVGEPLDVAFRLDRASRMRVRNDALRRAAALLSVGDPGPWTVAGRLLNAIERHHRLRRAPDTPLECAVAEACGAVAGLPRGMPTTEQGLFDIITG